jgi:hypothetical protein
MKPEATEFNVGNFNVLMKRNGELQNQVYDLESKLAGAREDMQAAAYHWSALTEILNRLAAGR